MWDFIKQNWGNLASVAGLIISVFTLLFAKRASQAAKEAKAAVLRRNVADDLEDAERMAQEIITFLRGKDWRISWYIAGELRKQAIRTHERWASLLEEESKNKIINTTLRLKFVIVNLDKITDNDLSEKQHKKLVKAAEEVRDIFFRERERFSGRIFRLE